MPSEVIERIARLEAAAEKDSAAERKLVELKICERCGGLWLRPAGSRWIYCGPCKAQVDDLPEVRLKPSRAAKLPTRDASAHEPIRKPLSQRRNGRGRV